MKIYAASNSDAAIRMRSSAGGVFSMLAERTLKVGGAVYGAAFDNEWNVAHRRITAVDDLDALRRSKYASSKMGTSIGDVMQDLSEGKTVLFSGTPCQVAALKKKAADNPKLLCVEIVCHGVPRADYWARYLAELCGRLGRTKEDISSINFRDKRTGWKNYSFSARFKDGYEFSQRHDDNPYMRAFLADYLLKESCFNCKYKYPQGGADITLGDFWGISQLAPEIDNNLGTTLVIAKTIKGQIALNEISCARMELKLSVEEVSVYNPALTGCSPKPSKYVEFKAEACTADSLGRLMKKYADRPFWQKFYMKMAFLKHCMFRD